MILSTRCTYLGIIFSCISFFTWYTFWISFNPQLCPPPLAFPDLLPEEPRFWPIDFHSLYVADSLFLMPFAMSPDFFSVLVTVSSLGYNTLKDKRFILVNGYSWWVVDPKAKWQGRGASRCKAAQIMVVRKQRVRGRGRKGDVPFQITSPVTCL